MSLLGIRLNLLVGPTVPIPAPPPVIEALEKVVITHKEEGRSGFELTFRVGRDNKIGALDYPALASQLVRPRMRAIVTVILGAIPRVLSDGIITNQQLAPSNEPGGAQLVVKGEDVSLALDSEEHIVEHPAQPDMLVAYKLIASHAQYGLIPVVIPPFLFDLPIPIERTPVQHGTDLAYLKLMAEWAGYVFFVLPGPVPATNYAYWGPPLPVGGIKRALTMNMGSATNVDSLNFSYEGDKVYRISAVMQDRRLNVQLPVEALLPLRVPLSAQPPFPFDLPFMRTRVGCVDSGKDIMQAYARALGEVSKSTDNLVTAQGTVDSVRYGDVLMPRSVVGVRGAGYHYDGLYYVRQVTHTIENDKYTQSFQLSREGLGSITPAVLP